MSLDDTYQVSEILWWCGLWSIAPFSYFKLVKVFIGWNLALLPPPTHTLINIKLHVGIIALTWTHLIERFIYWILNHKWWNKQLIHKKNESKMGLVSTQREALRYRAFLADDLDADAVSSINVTLCSRDEHLLQNGYSTVARDGSGSHIFHVLQTNLYKEKI